jgi:hypothetical protein
MALSDGEEESPSAELLVRWIQDQLPRVAEASLMHRHGSSRGLAQDAEIEVPSRPKWKRTRVSSAANSTSDPSDNKSLRKRGRPDDTAKDERRSKRVKNTASPTRQASPPPRRSACIVAKHAGALPPPAEIPPQSSHRKTRRSASAAAVPPSKRNDSGPKSKGRGHEEMRL